MVAIYYQWNQYATKLGVSCSPSHCALLNPYSRPIWPSFQSILQFNHFWVIPMQHPPFDEGQSIPAFCCKSSATGRNPAPMSRGSQPSSSGSELGSNVWAHGPFLGPISTFGFPPPHQICSASPFGVIHLLGVWGCGVNSRRPSGLPCLAFKWLMLGPPISGATPKSPWVGFLYTPLLKHCPRDNAHCLHSNPTPAFLIQGALAPTSNQHRGGAHALQPWLFRTFPRSSYDLAILWPASQGASSPFSMIILQTPLHLRPFRPPLWRSSSANS